MTAKKTKKIDPKFAWLWDEPGPRILLSMRNIYGTMEDTSAKSNPVILGWAKRVGLEKIYKSDAIYWCGLATAFAAADSGWPYAPNGNSLWARNWNIWETPVPKGKEMLGDVLIFERGKGGHVGLYVAEDSKYFYTLGGNQSDTVNIQPKEKKRLIGARRCTWRIAQPSNVRKIFVAPSGLILPLGKET